ncbi:hypothetical protein V3C99_011449 [Haemonchus contortus]
MCVTKKKGKRGAGKSKKRSKRPRTEKTKPKKAASDTAKSKESKSEQQADDAAYETPEKQNSFENIFGKPCGDDVLKVKKKQPLHIKVPPPRVMKAKRPMTEKKEAKDPEYKTLELENSEWESAVIVKRSDIKTEDIERKEFVEPAGQERQEKEAVEAAA